MGDIKRHIENTELQIRHPKLYIKELNVRLNEKLNQLKQLDVQLDYLRTVKVEELELQKSFLEKDIEDLKLTIRKKSV